MNRENFLLRISLDCCECNILAQFMDASMHSQVVSFCNNKCVTLSVRVKLLV